MAKQTVLAPGFGWPAKGANVEVVKLKKPKIRLKKEQVMKQSAAEKLDKDLPAPSPKPNDSPKQGSPVAAFRDPPATVDPLLVSVLSWRRKHTSPGELAFLGWLDTQISLFGAKPSIGPAGNRVVYINTGDGKMAETLFSCHVDTVDSAPYLKEGEHHQRVAYDANFGHLFLDPTYKSNGTCLGADDGVGIWIMLRMIEAKIPGTYVFHRGEEVGGVGAHAMLKDSAALLRLHKRAVAFDRPNCNEVITVQGGIQCASDDFGAALAKALNDADPEFDYKVSKLGVFTDTKVYRGVIPECVNLGVGYSQQHTSNEVLDYTHALALLDACKLVEWETLPTSRKPVSEPEQPRWGYPKQGSFYGGDDDFAYEWPRQTVPPKKPIHTPSQLKSLAGPDKRSASVKSVKEHLRLEEELLAIGGLSDIEEFCANSPEEAATLLVSFAAEVSALGARCKTLSNLLGIE